MTSTVYERETVQSMKCTAALLTQVVIAGKWNKAKLIASKHFVAILNISALLTGGYLGKRA